MEKSVDWASVPNRERRMQIDKSAEFSTLMLGGGMVPDVW